MSATRPPMHEDRTASSEAASRRGAHRARTKALSAGLPVLAGIAVILLVIGGIWIVVGSGGSSPSSSDQTVAAEPTSTENLPSADSTTGSSASSAPSTSTSTTTTEPDETTTTTDSGTTGGNVDKSVSVVVLNSTGVKGLAAKGESVLAGKGWNVTRTGNSINKGLTTTKIYYGDSDKQETAQAVQSALGYGQVFQDSSVTRAGITVVLGHDAE